MKNFTINKSIFTLIILISYFQLSFADEISINRISINKDTFERMEMQFSDYRIYTHRPGGIKIRRKSDGKQLLVFSDKFKVKFYNEGEKFFDFILDKEKEEISIKYKTVELFKWKGRYIKKHQAYFFQVFTYNNQPFHYYIQFKGKNPSALNMDQFEKKIAKAIYEAKIKIAAKYDLTPELIDLILKKRKLASDKKLNKIIQLEKESIEKTLEQTLNDTLQASINDEVLKQIDETIGQELAKEFDAIIIDGMEAEFASIVDEAVQEAISEGISQATAEAAIRAVMDVLAAGGNEEDAMNACRAVAGDAC